MNPKQKQRTDLVFELCAKDYNTFCYALTEFHQGVLRKFWEYSNDFLRAISKKIDEFGLQYYKECMKDDPQYGTTYLIFEKEFNQATIKYHQQLIINQQTYMENAGNPQQATYHQGNQNRNYQNQNQNYGGQNYQNQNYQPYHNQDQNYQKRPWNNEGNIQQIQQHQQHWQNYQQNSQQHGQNYQQHIQYYQNQNQRHNFQHNHGQQIQQGGQVHQNQQQTQYSQHGQYNQGGNYNQGSGYRPRNYHQKGNYAENQNYPQNQGQHHQGHQGQYSSQMHQGQQGYQGHHQHGGQYNQDRRHYKHGHSYGNHYNHKQQHEQKTLEPVEPEVPVEPPKPEPKPMKFSLKEIRQFVNSFPSGQKQNVSQNIIDKVNQVNGWTKRQGTFEEQPERTQAPRFDKKASTRDRQPDRSNTTTFNKGANYKPSEPAIQPKKPSGLTINLGKNETLQTRKIKESIKGKAGQDFASVMEKQQSSLDEVEKAKKEIIYNLNLLAPENIKAIKQDLSKFLYSDQRICKVLIEQIIEKAWAQPKYASTYAKLCSDFSKAKNQDFQFGDASKKQNPFKLILISNVQHSFDKKVQEVPEFKDEEEKETFLKNTKKKILGNVKFIAELIRSKVIRKRIMKICMAVLIHSFLSKYYNYRKTVSLVDSYFDYYFEALIEFVENVGDFYEKMDAPKNQQYSFPQIKKRIIDMIEMNEAPPSQSDQFEELNDLKPDEYFDIFNVIDQRVLKKKFSRLSALLLNLVERRDNNWQKHHAEAEGPKKLKDIKDDIAKEQQEMNRIKSEKKANLEHLNQLVKAALKNWQQDSNADNTKSEIKKILKEYSEVEFFASYLGQVADEKKEKVKVRVQMFDVILESFYKQNKFREAWLETVRKFGFASSDYPYSGAAFALILEKIKEKRGLELEKFFLQTTEEEEDERWFMEEVYDKLYFYTQWEDIKKYIESPKKKHSNML